MADFNVSPQLAAIAQWNPGIDLSADDVKAASVGDLILVGQGAVIPTGPVITLPGGRLTPKGCIESMRFQNGDEDLQSIVVDGTVYSGGNINEFRNVLTEAALAGKCINFCWSPRERRMTMLNVYPTCCCPCANHD